MFEIGKEYRVWSLKDGMGNREGILIARDGPMILLDVDGVQTVFHLASVASLELVDREAEEGRRQRNQQAWVDALT